MKSRILWSYTQSPPAQKLLVRFLSRVSLLLLQMLTRCCKVTGTALGCLQFLFETSELVDMCHPL